jgi:hypothetical protein
MGPPRVRFTVQRITVAVAVLALALTAADQLRRRRDSFKHLAEECRRKVSAAYMDEQVARAGNRFNHDPRTTAAYYQLVEHYSALHEKYEQAAQRPWFFVDNDVPEPIWPAGVPRLLVGPNLPPSKP